MQDISYARYRFPPAIIQHAVWLYYRFPLSYRDVEDLLAQRGVDVSYETVRRWALKFGQAYARRLRTTRPQADVRWHLDEVFVSIAGKRMYLWRAVDSEGEVLDILVQSRRNKKAALKVIRKLLKKQGFVPDTFITDKLPSYGAALKDLGLIRHHDFGGRKNNRAENSHLPVRQRERRMPAFQIGSISAAVSLYPRHRLQHLQRPTPSDIPKDITPVSQPRNGPVANRHRCRLSLSSMPIRSTTVQ